MQQHIGATVKNITASGSQLTARIQTLETGSATPGTPSTGFFGHSVIFTNENMSAEEKLTRIAVVNPDRCKPWKCAQECRKACPVNRKGQPCVEVTPSDKMAYISEPLCIGAGLCIKKCPFKAVSIVNLPTNLNKDTTHRYGPNSFKLHRLPVPQTSSVLGLVGSNGTGKTTALKILAGKLKPNLGAYDAPPDWNKLLLHFRGSALQNYFRRIMEDNLNAVIKPQHVDQMRDVIKGTVIENLSRKDEVGSHEEVCQMFDLGSVLDNEVTTLSGGELQRFTCAMVCVQKADIFMFDEPSSFLDVKQRLKAAQAIRRKVADDSYVIVVEHDLSVLDYLSDYICVLYGVPGAYGVVTMPLGIREGINIFLDGYLPSEKLRFRETALTFQVTDHAQRDVHKTLHHEYERMNKTVGKFELKVEPGEFTNSEIIVMLGENGTGKTTLIRMLAGRLDPDDGAKPPMLRVSYKPQQISPKAGTACVRELLEERITDAYVHPQFVTDVIKPLNIEDLLDEPLQNLSGGELQRVALTVCLGKPADLYLIDEPSAYLDSEQRIVAAKVIKRFILHAKKTAFVVEHDFIMTTYLADRVIVFEGEPSISAMANSPQPLLTGMNKFLETLNVTFRRDPKNFRPRINQLNGVHDREQKASGNYFFLED